MPRGVYDRSKAKPRKSKKAKTAKAFTKPGKVKAVNMKAVKKPVKAVKTAPEPAKVMDVPAFLDKLKVATEALRACSGMTTHSKEAELLKNFAICLERQVEAKYKLALRNEG